MFEAYVKKQDRTLVVTLIGNQHKPTTPQKVTKNVDLAVRYYFRPDASGQSCCTFGCLRAFNTYDFLFGASSGADLINKLDSPAAGHDSITYFQFASRHIARKN